MSDFTFLKGASDWWRQAVVYQIYPRSFSDFNGDGIGDLRGIISKVDYLAALGIDAVWLSPFYPSALADGGYDVDDYRDIDKRIGSLAEFDELVDALHQKNIRIFVDIVPNHSSDQHVWFQEALASEKGSKARDRYIFRDGRGENGELAPSDLSSHFGPDGWTRTSDGQWYMHLFTKEQPDFNWDNPEVHEEFLKTLRFWSDRGVDGYRIDVAHALKKKLEPELPNRGSYALDVMKTDGSDQIFDRDEVHEVYRQWRKLFNEYDPPRVAVAEAWVHPHRIPAYASIDGLGQAFNFDLLSSKWDALEIRQIVEKNLELSNQTGSSNTLVLSNHDVIRHATRLVLPIHGKGDIFGDEAAWYVKNRLNHELDLDLGLQRAKAATLMILALPGSTYIYQGEELGLHEALEIPSDQMQDPQWFRGEGKFKSRDGCRVPLPWEATGPSFGFGSSGAHLPQPKWYSEVAVATQESDPNSTLNLYRKAIHLRRELEGAESLSWLVTAPEVVSFERPGGWVSVTNFGSDPVLLPEGELLISSSSIIQGELAGNSTAWLRR